jgi:glycosyltransferase involved in cell wall biosynthesis
MSLPGRSFGGFETFISGLAPRLAARGHAVTVYSRSALFAEHPAEFEGVHLRWLPSLEGKVIGTPSHVLVCMLDAVRKGFDAMLVVNPGMGLHCAIPRLLSSTRLVMNVDGVEWKRGKWGPLGRWYYRTAARASTKLCHAIVADSQAMADLYWREFGARAVFVPYAFDVRDAGPPDRVRALGLEAKGYYLVVGRLIPENNTDFIVSEFGAAGSDRPLVVVGGSNYSSEFHRRLAATAGKHVRFLGHVDDMELLWSLFGHSYAYIHGHSVGGTNPALLQCMAVGACPIAFDVEFNREVAGDAGIYFRREPGALAAAIRSVDGAPAEVARRGALARARLARHYTWTRVVDGYEAVLSGRPLKADWFDGPDAGRVAGA